MDLTFKSNEIAQDIDLKKKVVQIPRRFFGPVAPADAAEIVDSMLDDNSLRDTLIRLAAGEQEPREAIFEIQLLMEAEEKRRENADRESRAGMPHEGDRA